MCRWSKKFYVLPLFLHSERNAFCFGGYNAAAEGAQTRARLSVFRRIGTLRAALTWVDAARGAKGKPPGACFGEGVESWHLAWIAGSRFRFEQKACRPIVQVPLPSRGDVQATCLRMGSRGDPAPGTRKHGGSAVPRSRRWDAPKTSYERSGVMQGASSDRMSCRARSPELRARR